jgi:hypothetical protein
MSPGPEPLSGNTADQVRATAIGRVISCGLISRG